MAELKDVEGMFFKIVLIGFKEKYSKGEKECDDEGVPAVKMVDTEVV